jgi:hypothetical protein
MLIVYNLAIAAPGHVESYIAICYATCKDIKKKPFAHLQKAKN